MKGPTVTILHGHVVDKLASLPGEYVQCVVTSPPYWGLRDYSRCECAVKQERPITLPKEVGGFANHEAPVAFRSDAYSEGGTRANKEPNPNCPKCHGTGKDDSLTVVWDAKEGCEHEWSTDRWYTNAGSSTGVAGQAFSEPGEANARRIKEGRWREASTCDKCGAWRGQLGLEPTPDLYVDHLVQVFREVKRVLRDDGTLWLNMGDSYVGGGGYAGADKHPEWWDDSLEGGADRKMSSSPLNPPLKRVAGLKPKDLVGMPWRIAFALQADGWYLRSDIIWAKPNPMPESVTDRPTKAHEYVFLLTKKSKYLYDADAVREENVTFRDGNQFGGKNKHEGYGTRSASGNVYHRVPGRNLRTVWTIPTQPYPESHFATFPEALVERCIKAGTSEKGCCATCGAPWKRMVEESTGGSKGSSWHNHSDDSTTGNAKVVSSVGYKAGETIGFRPACGHDDDPIPCIVLDPFAGSGTVGEIARSLGRSSVLVEIKEQYVELAKKRTDYDRKTLERFA